MLPDFINRVKVTLVEQKQARKLLLYSFITQTPQLSMSTPEICIIYLPIIIIASLLIIGNIRIDYFQYLSAHMDNAREDRRRNQHQIWQGKDRLYTAHRPET